MSDEQDQVVDLTEDDLEIEIQDDTPEQDRGRRKAETSEPAAATDDDDEDLTKHSESVQKRIKKLKFEFHEERRRKEAADREREAAITYAEKIKRDSWAEEKTREVKELTIKGLEPEIQRLMAKHKADLRKVRGPWNAIRPNLNPISY